MTTLQFEESVACIECLCWLLCRSGDEKLGLRGYPRVHIVFISAR